MPHTAAPSSPSISPSAAFRHILAIMLLALIGLGVSQAHAAVFYHYLYIGQPYSQGDGGFYESPNTAASFLSAEILSPTPLTAGSANLIDTPGLSFRMWDDTYAYTYEKTAEPYLAPMPPELIAEYEANPDPDMQARYPDYPLMLIEPPYSFAGTLVFTQLDASGLPTAWIVELIYSYAYDDRARYSNFLLSQHGDDTDPQYDITGVRGYLGGSPAGASYNTPGSWQLSLVEMQALPEPASLSLLIGALAALKLSMRSGKRLGLRRQRAERRHLRFQPLPARHPRPQRLTDKQEHTMPITCTPASWRRLHQAAALLLLAMLPCLASTAAAAPLYRYTYTGLPYSQGDGSTYDGGNTAASFLSAEITSRTPLTAGLGNLINTPGLTFRMWDDNSDFTYEKTVAPYLALLPQSVLDDYEANPSEDIYLSYPNFPYTLVVPPYHFEASIIFAELDGSGVPIAWELSLSLLTYDPERLDTYTHGLYSSNWDGASFEPQADTNTAGGRTGASTFGASFNNPGSWQLTILDVQALPEPASSALLLGGLVALAALRNRRRAAQP